VGKDGLRFLNVILRSAFLYRPSRPLGLLGLLFLVAAVTLMWMPARYYLAHRAVTEWMIYRFVVSHLAGTSACLLFCAGYLTRKMVKISLGGRAADTPESLTGRLEQIFEAPSFWLVPLALVSAGITLVIPSFVQLVKTGATYEHWSRFIAMSFLCSSALILVIARVIAYVLSLVSERLAYFESRNSPRKQS
jgi:hypothetical protein